MLTFSHKANASLVMQKMFNISFCLKYRVDMNFVFAFFTQCLSSIDM